MAKKPNPNIYPGVVGTGVFTNTGATNNSISANLQKANLQDLQEIYKSFPKELYEYNDKNDFQLIKENTVVQYENDSKIVFRFSKKNLRKIKLEILQKTDEGAVWEKILRNSKMVNNYEVIEAQLVDELTKSINNEIMKKMREIGGGNMNFSYTMKRD